MPSLYKQEQLHVRYINRVTRSCAKDVLCF